MLHFQKDEEPTRGQLDYAAPENEVLPINESVESPLSSLNHM